jgi:hypothetical protein
MGLAAEHGEPRLGDLAAFFVVEIGYNQICPPKLVKDAPPFGLAERLAGAECREKIFPFPGSLSRLPCRRRFSRDVLGQMAWRRGEAPM